MTEGTRPGAAAGPRTPVSHAFATSPLTAPLHSLRLTLPKLPKVGKELPDAPEADVMRLHSPLTRVFDRVGRGSALEVRDVDLKRNELHVRRAFSASEVLTPKSGDERLVRDVRIEVDAALRGGADLVNSSDTTGPTPAFCSSTAPTPRNARG